MVNYSRWKATASDVSQLNDYLTHLSQADLKQRATRESKLAFYVNAYNAVTIHGILREYPTNSIRNHTAKVFGYNIWHDLLLRVGNGQLSLDQIEHEVLRKMREPRIHFAIVCASIGCPPLRNEAYRPERIENQLMDNARVFFADSTKFRYDADAARVEMSPILDWFGEDFGSTTAARLKAIAPYLPDEPSRRLAASGQAQVSFLDYDWGINDKKK